MEGHLTATIHGTEEDLAEHRDLIAILESKVGRLLFNGFPTGVEVCHAMVHGGPYPATSDGRSTSVGTQAIFRFARPFCYQDFPDSALPAELQNGNPLGIHSDGERAAEQRHDRLGSQPSRRDLVDQRTDRLDGDANLVSSLQRERVRRDDSGPGHQKCPVRKTVVAKEIFGKSRWLAFQSRRAWLRR
jgi:hypothetical protein